MASKMAASVWADLRNCVNLCFFDLCFFTCHSILAGYVIRVINNK